MTTITFDRRPLALAAAVFALPLVVALTACEKTESKSSTTSTKVSETPDGGVKKTTETTEKKVETTPK